MLQRINGPTWKGKVCVLPTRKALGGEAQFSDLSLDLGAFDLERNSFLRLAIENQSYPMQRSIANKFQRALREIQSDKTAVKTLSSSVGSLGFRDVVSLFTLIEDRVATWGDKSRLTMSRHAIKPLLEVPGPLGDGTTAASSGFVTRFSRPRAVPKTPAAERPLHQDPAPLIDEGVDGDGPQPHDLIDALQFHSLSERDAKAFHVSAGRKEEIAQICIDVFDRHERLVQIIKEAKAAGVPSLPPAQIAMRGSRRGGAEALLSLPEADQLRVILGSMEGKKFHLGPSNTKFSMPLYGLGILAEYLPQEAKDSSKLRRELLLSDYYLPTQVVGACLVAIQNDKMSPTDLISTLTSGDVEVTKKGYRYVAIRPKTDQSQGRDVERRPIPETPRELHLTGAAAVKAFELLLRNAATIEDLHGLTEVKLLTCVHRKFRRLERLEFVRKTPYDLIREFCRFNKLAAFDTRYLRGLGLQTEVLSPWGDIFTAQAKAGHKDARTTEEYVHTNVRRHLQMANIRRFMDMLAGSILWRTGRDGLLEQSGLGKRGLNLQLLFPIDGDDEDEQSAVDEWIASGNQEKKQIPIGLDELDQCAAQYAYYVNSLATLPQENPKRFYLIHLPRILTCFALRKIILMTPYAFAYRKYERHYA